MKQQSNKPEFMLEECLEKLLQEGETIDSSLRNLPTQAESLRPELEAAAWLGRKREALEPRAGFVGASKSNLVTRVVEQKAEVGLKRRTAIGWRSLIKSKKFALYLETVLLLFVTVFYTGRNLVRASNSWLPGDFLYPAKTVLEQVALILTFDPKEDGALHIEYAQRRILEAQALFFEDRYEEVPPTILNFGYHVSGAVLKVNQVAKRDPVKAREMARKLEGVLSGQTHLVLLMAGFSPAPTRVEFERAVQISEEGLIAVQNVLDPGSGKIESMGICKVMHIV